MITSVLLPVASEKDQVATELITFFHGQLPPSRQATLDSSIVSKDLPGLALLAVRHCMLSYRIVPYSVVCCLMHSSIPRFFNLLRRSTGIGTL